MDALMSQMSQVVKRVGITPAEDELLQSWKKLRAKQQQRRDTIGWIGRPRPPPGAESAVTNLVDTARELAEAPAPQS